MTISAAFIVFVSLQEPHLLVLTAVQALRLIFLGLESRIITDYSSMETHTDAIKTLFHSIPFCFVASSIFENLSGVLAIRNWAGNAKNFRISATGTVLDTAPNFKILKKLKLVGEPQKIMKNTAFIKKMLTSDLEVAKCEGTTHMQTACKKDAASILRARLN